MKRYLIVIVAGLAFGVTAAYATTGHSGAAPARTPHSAAPQTFAVPGDTTASSAAPTTGSDDPLTHDQADDQGQDEQGQDQQGQDQQGEDQQGEDQQGQDEQGQDEATSSSQDGSSQ